MPRSFTAQAPGRAVFLDRDGVLVEILRDAELGILFTAFHPDQLRVPRGTAEALERLASLGFQRIVVSNQPGVAKGHFTAAQLERTHERLSELLPFEALYACLHHPEGAPGGDPLFITSCECRKPRPGLLLQAARERNIELARSVFIGDSTDDVSAGKAAGVRTVLINGGRCELCPNKTGGPSPDAVARTLGEAVDWVAANLT